MTTVPIANSSLIDQLERDEDGTVRARFKSTGSTYEYTGITRKMFDEWSTASSAGGYYHANIKNNPDLKSRKL